MNAAADVIESDIVSLAGLLTLEMGKPIAQATAEVTKCAHAMRFYARNAEAFRDPRVLQLVDDLEVMTGKRRQENRRNVLWPRSCAC